MGYNNIIIPNENLMEIKYSSQSFGFLSELYKIMGKASAHRKS